MSVPILPFAVWNPGTNQNSIPANDNALRNQILNGLVISDSVDAQPVSPSDGDIYIITTSATGSQWSLFDPFDLTIFDSGTWYAFAPVDGVVVNLAGQLIQWSGSSGYTSIGGLSDAPSDGSVYGRRNGGWEEVSEKNAVTVAASTSGTITINCSEGDYFTHALDENISTWSFTNLPGSGKGASKMIRITQDSTPRTVAWPASFIWTGGTDGVVSTGSGVIDVLAITTFDNGTTWMATLANGFAT